MILTYSALQYRLKAFKDSNSGWISHWLAPPGTQIQINSFTAPRVVVEGEELVGYPIHLSPDVVCLECSIMVVIDGERHYMSL